MQLAELNLQPDNINGTGFLINSFKRVTDAVGHGQPVCSVGKPCTRLSVLLAVFLGTLLLFFGLCSFAAINSSSVCIYSKRLYQLSAESPCCPPCTQRFAGSLGQARRLPKASSPLPTCSEGQSGRPVPKRARGMAVSAPEVPPRLPTGADPRGCKISYMKLLKRVPER